MAECCRGSRPGCGCAGPVARNGHCDDVAQGSWRTGDLSRGHYRKDGIEVVNVQGAIDIYTAPRLREVLIDLASTGSYHLVVDLDKAGLPGSAGLGVLAGGLNRVRPHDGSLDLAGTREPILKTFKIRAAEELGHLPDSGPGHRGQGDHPALLATVSREDLLSWIQAE